MGQIWLQLRDNNNYNKSLKSNLLIYSNSNCEWASTGGNQRGCGSVLILYNYLIEFKRIQINDYKRSFIELIWPNNWLGSQIFIWSDESH
jgi:hypothetical protein